MKLLLFILLFLLSNLSIASSEIIVRLSDYPRTAPVYSPLYLFGEIENTGPTTEAVIVEGLHGGAGFEISKANGHLSIAEASGTSIGDHVVVLAPKEKHIIQRSHGLELFSAPGVYEVRAVLEGSGKCHLLYPDEYSLTRLPVEEGDSVPFHRCWEGKVQSEVVKIRIDEPVTKTDIEALNYIKNSRFGKIGKMNTAFSEAYSYLKEMYPDSYYTFVAGYQNVDYLIRKEILELQPSHPLAEYVRLNVGLWDVLESYFGQERKGTKQFQKRTELNDLPMLYQRYFAQYARELEQQKKLEGKKPVSALSPDEMDN